MATKPVSPPSAEIVGNLFVSQYYQILHESPETVYKFYHDSSVLTRPDYNGRWFKSLAEYMNDVCAHFHSRPRCIFTLAYFGNMELISLCKGIHKKIMSMDYLNYEAEIQSADFQKSYKDGVFVLVTGYLMSKDYYRRKFTQSFFLAPQRNGYYVRNDIFQFVEDMKPLISPPANREEPKTASLTQYLECTSISDPSFPERITHVIDSHANEKILEATNSENCVADDVTAIKQVPSCSKKDVGSSTISMLGSFVAEDNAPKKQYASSSKKDVGTSAISISGSSVSEDNAPKQPYASTSKKDVGISTISVSSSYVVEDNAPKEPYASRSKKDVGTSTISTSSSSIAEDHAPKQLYASGSKKDVGTSTIYVSGSSAGEEIAPKQPYASSSKKDVGTSTIFVSGSSVAEFNSPNQPYASNSKKDVGISSISVSGSSFAEENAPNQPYASSSKKDVATSTISEFGLSFAEEIAPKKSYASIMSSPPRIHNYQEPRRTYDSEKIKADLPDDPVKLPLVKIVKQSGGPITSSSSLHGSPNSPCDEVVKHSIYVRNLPVNVTAARLEHVFENFGPIKKGGVKVRSHKHLKHCFGFVEFESMISVNDAMQASPIFIGGQEVVVEIKKATKVGSDKAWVPPGKGLSKHDNFRIHEKFGGGRGQSKIEFGTNHYGRGSKGLSGHGASMYHPGRGRTRLHRGQNEDVVSP